MSYLLAKYCAARRHPLSKFPGPPIAKFSNIWFSWTFLRGRQPYDILAAHEKYGPVVRIAPNELSFNTASSYGDIYGARIGHKTFVRSSIYDSREYTLDEPSINLDTNPDTEGKMRKCLLPAFSGRSMRNLESVILERVNKVMDQIGCQDDGPCGTDLSSWFRFVTMDIIGQLTLGHSFGNVERRGLDPWGASVENSVAFVPIKDAMDRFPWLGKIIRWTFAPMLQRFMEIRKSHDQYMVDMIEQRLKRPRNEDLVSRVADWQLQENKEVSATSIAAILAEILIAGSHTSSATLATISMYLLTNHDARKKLQAELNTAFSNPDEITGSSTASLKYLEAVVNEGLRIYPPIPVSLPRIVPKGGDTVDGHFLPEGTIVSTSHMGSCLSSENFSDPWIFKPERWLDSSCTDKFNACKVFSIGPQSCIGQSLALMEIRTIIAHLFFRYELDMVDKDLDWHKKSRIAPTWVVPELRVRVRPKN
ncbi:hypothetical protein AARAC_003711 [Aspergillus arachidicola]|uniref:Cytochrome P450 n=1 Tax=Aspergillus arachidicola TaxID=656916 RepID=A0A2G7FML1_9EURO|nr:hypothetical protein AARAC_003711 [Aspergillus arachidicola]